MQTIDIFIRYSDQNVRLEKVATLSKEDDLVYNDEGGNFKAHVNTTLKFALLTVGSPLISLARLIRSVVFILNGELAQAGREFIGALAMPLIATFCLAGSLLSTAVYLASDGNITFYTSLRRIYANFESWMNNTDFQTSYSHRVSRPMECFKGRIWTTAPCMQPVLENGYSRRGGLFDIERMRKVFPHLKVNDVQFEGRNLVIQSEYENATTHYTACNGTYEHWKDSRDCCCCYRIESVYDRVLCCEVAQGSCSSTANSNDSCGIVSASCCGVGACCCYATGDNINVTVNTGCFGPEGFFCVN